MRNSIVFSTVGSWKIGYRSVFLVLFGWFPGVFSCVDAQQVMVVPQIRAHAHNDYYHKRPLLDALQHGFTSVEADIMLKDGELLVGHSRLEARGDRTLDALYLAPLAKRVKENKGTVYLTPSRFILLIDFKTQAADTLAVLQKQIQPYRSMLTRYEQGTVHQGAVTIILSGNRPVAEVAKLDDRYLFIDGRFPDLNNDITTGLVPLVSAPWNRTFSWQGFGTMSDGELMKLRTIIKSAHAQKKLVRFWALPERENLWQLLYDEGIDLINVDDLPRLEKFLQRQPDSRTPSKPTP